MGIDIHFSELSTFLSRSPTFATARAIDRREPASIAGRLFAGMICEQRIHWMLDGNFALRSEAPSARPLCQPHLQPLRVVSENVVYTETKQPFPIVRLVGRPHVDRPVRCPRHLDELFVDDGSVRVQQLAGQAVERARIMDEQCSHRDAWLHRLDAYETFMVKRRDDEAV